MSLIASPDVVVVRGDPALQFGTTQIYYKEVSSGLRLILWERTNRGGVQGPWIRLSLTPPRIQSAPSGDPKREGVFSQRLGAGDVYEVVMYHDERIDPNAIPPKDASREQKPDASVTVVGLRNAEPANLIVSHDQNAGGTWFKKTVKTNKPTFFMLQVSRSQPFVDAQGVERFLAPVATVFGTSNLDHTGQVEPLLPGNDLFYLMRVVDADGDWQIVSDSFRTKQRKVTINFDQVHIVNDGVPGNTTAEFRIWVVEGEAVVKNYYFGDVENFEISDRPDPGNQHQEYINLPPLCPTFVLGPKDVTDENSHVGLLTRGLIERNAGANEWSSNYFGGQHFPDQLSSVPMGGGFHFPTGDGEIVQNALHHVQARPQIADEEFAYDLTARFTVEYL